MNKLKRVKMSLTETKDCNYRWPNIFVYGDLNKTINPDIEYSIFPDIEYFNEKTPKESGLYFTIYNNEEVVINFSTKVNGGRACYLYDTEGLKQIISREDWE